MVKEINNENFNEEVLNAKGNVLVDFNAEWCGPCKMLRPILDEISSERSDGKIVSVNVDSNSELAMKYGVSSIPCLVLFKGGKEVNRSVGLIPKEKIEEILRGE